MTILLTCCRTHQSVIEKSTVIAKDTMTISRVAAKDSALLNAKIDSIIIEEYAADQGELTNNAHSGPNYKLSSYRNGNDTSQKGTGSLKKKTKIYGANISGTWSTTRDSLNKKMTHQQTTNSDIKQKTPIQTTAGKKIIYVLVGITLLLIVGYLNWKNAVQ